MIKLLSILLTFLATPLFAKVIKTETAGSITYEFTVEDLQHASVEHSGEWFDKLSLAGIEGYQAFHGEVGAPRLPVIRFYVSGGKSFKVTASASESLRNVTQLVPVPPSVLKVPGARRDFVINRAAYAAKRNLAPAHTVEASGSVRGRPQHLVTLFPVRLGTTENSIAVTRKFKVEIERRQASVKSKSNELLAFVVGAQLANSAALARYESFKQSQGFATTRIIYGTDASSASDVRQKLQALLSDNLRYAIIVGDIDDVPGKNAKYMSGPTDHYYRAIDTDDYDGDINGPDIGVGRFSANTESELDAIVTKYTRYQEGAFEDESWISQAAFLATSDGGFWKVAEGTHNYVVEQYTKHLGYTGSFPQESSEGGDKLYHVSHSATAADVRAAIERGRSLVVYSGHGWSGGWHEPRFDSSNVRNLTNPDFIPVALGFACDTADYRVSDNIAETWQRHPFGAIVYWGSVDSSLWDEDDILEKALFDTLFRDQQSKFSAMSQAGLKEVWRQYNGKKYSKYYWESYTTFGDPSVEVRVPAQR